MKEVYLFAIYKGWGLFIFGGLWCSILISVRLIEIYLFKVHIISAEEKRFREERRLPSIALLICLILILLAIFFYSYNH